MSQFGLTSNETGGYFFAMLMKRQAKKKLSDGLLARAMNEEFGTTRYDQRLMRMYRNRYNRGELNARTGRPASPVLRYDDDGKVFAARRGPPPKR
jgi:hypothetical protein